MDDVVVTEELAATRDGLTQLRRSWQPPAGAPMRAAALLVHGIGEHSGRYDHVGRYLAGHGLAVAAFDNRGHGQSGGPRGHIDDFSQFLDDVEDGLARQRALGLPVVLIGHSLGGLIATAYAVSSRAQPDAVVLSAPALDAQVAWWQRRAAPALARMAPRLFLRGDIDGALLSRDPNVQAAYKSDPLRVAGSTAGLGQAILTAMAATRAQLDGLRRPTYVLHGGDDRLVPPTASQPLDGRQLVTYRLWPGLRHECFNEPEQTEVLAEMATWIDRQLAAIPQTGSD